MTPKERHKAISGLLRKKIKHVLNSQEYEEKMKEAAASLYESDTGNYSEGLAKLVLK